MEKSYLQWLTTETPTRWWHDSAIPAEIQAGIQRGALGVTTNPVLTYKTLQACPDFWRDKISLTDDVTGEDRALAYLKMVATYAAKQLEPVYQSTGGKHGYAFGQLNPSRATDAAAMIEMGRKVASWAPNVAVKLPATAAGLEVIEELAASGIALCVSINFSVAQAIAVCESYRRGLRLAKNRGNQTKPCFTVQQLGRVDDYLRDVARESGLDLTEDEISQAGLAVVKRSYEIARSERYEAVIMPAGLRGVHHLTELAGAAMTFSLHPRIQQMVLDADPAREERIEKPIDRQTLDKLKQMPEFIKAYEPDGLAPKEFFTYGLTQKVLSQFVESGWAPLETYGSSQVNQRWT